MTDTNLWFIVRAQRARSLGSERDPPPTTVSLVPRCEDEGSGQFQRLDGSPGSLRRSGRAAPAPLKSDSFSSTSSSSTPDHAALEIPGPPMTPYWLRISPGTAGIPGGRSETYKCLSETLPGRQVEVPVQVTSVSGRASARLLEGAYVAAPTLGGALCQANGLDTCVRTGNKTTRSKSGPSPRVSTISCSPGKTSSLSTGSSGATAPVPTSLALDAADDGSGPEAPSPPKNLRRFSDAAAQKQKFFKEEMARAEQFEKTGSTGRNRSASTGAGTIGAALAPDGDDGTYAFVLDREFLDEFGTGVMRIDVQHKWIFDAIDRLEMVAEAPKTYDARADSKMLFNGLIAYCRLHLLTEEGLMQRFKYPDFEAHKRDHDAFAERINEAAVQIDWGTTDRPDVALAHFLREWFSVHILQMDVDLGRYLLSVKEQSLQQGRPT
eukprot:m51a1_g1505 hypothetical protein (437) ;mRNA; r:376426-378364